MVKVEQHVVQRHKSRNSFVTYLSGQGVWGTKQMRTTRFFKGRGFGLGRNLNVGGGQRGSVNSSTVTMGLAVVAVVAVGLLGFFYLQQVFGTAERGTDIQALEKQVDELRAEQKELELEGAQLRSIQAVEETVKELNLVATEQVAYLVIPSERVALNAR